MKNNYRNTVNKISKLLDKFLRDAVNTVTSVMRMFVLAKLKCAFKSNEYYKYKTKHCCTILANGPSLKTAFEQGEVLLDDHDVFCVNMFVEADEFWILKPKFYCLVDGEYFCPTMEHTKQQVEFLRIALNKVNWDMFLYVSASWAKGGVLDGLNNPHIQIIGWNTNTFDSFKFVRHYFYRQGLGMPRCQTVTNFALTAAIKMKYREINLYGADHTWTRDLTVNNENVVCYGDRHVYAIQLQKIELDYSIATVLREFANMFESHWIINEFAKSMNVKIYNCTNGSFVDAYERRC